MRRLRRDHRKTEGSHVDSEGSWAISYGDMITLLLSFFVLYFTVDHDKVRANQLQQSLVMKLQESGIESDKANIRKLNIGLEEGFDIDKRVLSQVGARVHEVGSQLVVEFENVSFFDFGQVDVTTAGVKALEEFAQTYVPFAGNYDLSIRAFTDTRSVRPTNPRFKDNLELSALRSVAAMRILQKAGLPLASMKLAGFGELKILNEAMRSLAATAQDPLALARKVILVIEPKRVTEGE